MKYLVLAAFFAMTGLYLYYQRLKNKPGSGLIKRIAVKCSATLMAALVGLVGAIDSGLPAHWMIFAGIVMGAVADGILCVHFMMGVATFAVGHVLYIIGFSMLRLPGWGSLMVFACLLAGFSALCARWKRHMGRRAPMLLGYGMLLALMTSVSAAQQPLLFAGGLLFAVSDALLAYRLFMRSGVKTDYASLGMYYLAQFLMGLAIYLQ